MRSREVIYRLTVSEAGSLDSEAFTVEADLPFGTMTAGDLFTCDTVEGLSMSDVTGQISRVEHRFHSSSAERLIHHTTVHLAPATSRVTEALARSA